MKFSQITFLANSFSFLETYKSSLSQQLCSLNCVVTWVFPSLKSVDPDSDLNPIILLPIRSLRSGLYFIFRLFYWSIIFFRNNPYSLLVSHTAYCNIVVLLALLISPSFKSRVYIFVSGFGPSRIRNSLRIRLLARFYLSLLRYASHHPKVFICALNLSDMNLIQDFDFSRRVHLIREASIPLSDFSLGESIMQTRLHSPNIHSLRVGFLGRFLLEKGLLDFLLMSQQLRKLDLDLTFSIAGCSDSFNNSSIPGVIFESITPLSS